jgi:hypothetical protein
VAVAAMLMLAQPLFGYMWTINNDSDRTIQVCQTYKQFPNFDGQNCATIGPMGTLGPYSVGGYCTVNFIVSQDGGWDPVGFVSDPIFLACTGGIVDIRLNSYQGQPVGYFVTMTGVGSSQWSIEGTDSSIVVNP